MALLDILTGGQRSSGRVPPLAKALAGLLSYSKLKNPGGAGSAGGPDYGERLEEFFKPSASGGPTAKGVIGALLTGGMMDLVQQFRGAGKADAVESWVARGPNKAVSSDDLSRVLTEEQIAFLTRRTGLSREELLAGLSERLPQVVDELTPEGRVPTPEEMQRKI
jgi:uncharacterized protein YidB (DUF937 family)